ncbi:hypothetical protein D3C81_2303540 [compost metagenome]
MAMVVGHGCAVLGARRDFDAWERLAIDGVGIPATGHKPNMGLDLRAGGLSSAFS